MNGRYIEVDGKPVPCEDLMEWGTWFEKADREVAKHIVNGIRVSTIFLGLDHGFGGKLLLYETMTFNDRTTKEVSGLKPFVEIQKRYATRAEAIIGHGEVIDEIK